MRTVNEGRVAWHFSGEKRDYSIKGAGKIGCPCGKKNKFGSHPYTILRNQLQMDEGLKCQKQTLKHSVEKYRWISFRPWGREGFLKRAQKVQTIQGKIYDFDFIKVQKLCSSEKFSKKSRKQATN